MQDVHNLIVLGQQACDYLYNDVKLVAVNHPAGFPCYRDPPHPANQSTESMGEDLFGRKRTLHAELRVQRAEFFGGDPNAFQQALWVKKLGFGSCDDFAALAYHYLMNLENTHTFYAGVVQTNNTYDHAFLILDSKPILAEFVLDGDRFREEMESAVVCDPWANSVFSAANDHAVIDYFSRVPQFNRICFSSGLMLSRKYPEWTKAEQDYFLS